jgi:hypothetical protein
MGRGARRCCRRVAPPQQARLRGKHRAVVLLSRAQPEGQLAFGRRYFSRQDLADGESMQLPPSPRVRFDRGREGPLANREASGISRAPGSGAHQLSPGRAVMFTSMTPGGALRVHARDGAGEHAGLRKSGNIITLAATCSRLQVLLTVPSRSRACCRINSRR